jgi:ATP-dependent Lhr-like helicase
VLAQQVVAEVAAQDWHETALYDRMRRAWPFSKLTRTDFDAVVRMLAQGFTTRRGRKGALIHRHGVNHILRARRGASTTALTSGGTIPDTADYRVLLEPENIIIGSVNEDFAVERPIASSAWSGAQSGSKDAHGQPPTIPFWLGEAPGRTDELSVSVLRLRADTAARLRSDPAGVTARRWLVEDVGIAPPAAEQLVEHLAAGAAAFGCLPTQETVVLERFFDEAGGMQLVIHAPFGSRINRAWGFDAAQVFLPEPAAP